MCQIKYLLINLTNLNWVFFTIKPIRLGLQHWNVLSTCFGRLVFTIGNCNCYHFSIVIFHFVVGFLHPALRLTYAQFTSIRYVLHSFAVFILHIEQSDDNFIFVYLSRMYLLQWLLNLTPTLLYCSPFLGALHPSNVNWINSLFKFCIYQYIMYSVLALRVILPIKKSLVII